MRGAADEIPTPYRWVLDEEPEYVAERVPPLVRELIEILGLEGAVALLARFAKQQVYIPDLERSLRVLRDERIKREFDGANHVALARRYGLAVGTIYTILRRDETAYHQESLFD